MEEDLPEPDLTEAISKANRWSEQAWDLIDGIDFATSRRSVVSVALFHLSMEHYTGIVTLVSEGINSSGFALARPQLEAHLRGLWYGLCATDAEVERFIDGYEPPNKTALISALEATPAFGVGSLDMLDGDYWRSLCDYTHGGSLQMKARVVKGDILSNFSPSHVARMLNASSTLAQINCTGLGRLIESPKFANDAYNAYQTIYRRAKS